jgi:adenylylsulfate kinase-like enzyme
MTNDRPKMPPTDAQIVAAFIAEAETKGDLLSGGEIAARRELADSLALAKIERAEYIKDAGERVASAFSDAGKKIAAALVKFNADADKEK